jgi:hypothetical protein
MHVEEIGHASDRLSSETDDKYRFAGLLGFVLLSIVPLLLILIHGVNVPVNDEWGIVRLIRSVYSGHPSIDAFWAVNNDHRMLFPNIVFALVCCSIGWNSVVLMLISWAMAVIAAFFLFYDLAGVFDSARPRLWVGTVAVVSLIFFSPNQQENWLWGFQIAFFIVQVSVIVGIFTISGQSLKFRTRLAISIVCGVIASYSSAQGLMIWPALCLTLAITNQSTKEKITGICWLLLAAIVTISLYFFRYTATSPGHTELSQLLQHPGSLLLYFTSLLGAPLLAWLPDNIRLPGSSVLGAVLICLFIILAVRSLRSKHRAEIAPWIGLGSFALAFCLITTYGRIGLGVGTGVLSGRYTTPELLFAVVVLALMYISGESTNEARWPVNRFFNTGFLCCFAILAFMGYIDGFQKAAHEHKLLVRAKMLLPFLNYFDSKVDGLPTGPLFVLLQARNVPVFDTWFKYYLEFGYAKAVTDAKFVESGSGLKGNIFIRADKASPAEIVDATGEVNFWNKGNNPLVFVRNSGNDKFIGATEMRPYSRGEYSGAYRWQIPISKNLIVNDGKDLEVWVYEAGSFLKVEQSK